MPTAFSYGVSAYFPIGSLFYWSAGIALASYNYMDSIWSDTTGLLMGLGMMVLLDDMELFVGGRTGYVLNLLEFNDGSTIDYEGLPFGAEGGVAWKMFEGGAVVLRLFWQAGILTASGYFDVEYSEMGMMLGVAWTF
ncbi:MAG: hypothetical protein E4H20_09195 [Spirochaetales bacterium]|nr:MAG: hypothetical protein E4H20_09195 [Spirochaetales bacterium]